MPWSSFRILSHIGAQFEPACCCVFIPSGWFPALGCTVHPRGRRVRSPGTAGPRDTAISTSNGAPGPLEPAPEARMTPQFALLTPRFRPFVASCCLRCCDERTQAVRHNSHDPWRHCYRTQRFQKACTCSSLHPSHRYSLMVPIFSINLPVRALLGL